MKILITGGTGQLGRDCEKVLARDQKVTAVGSRSLDISDRKAVDAFIGDLRPDVVLNCAAFTRVDDCETQKELVWKINVVGPENLATAARTCGSRMVHISTDYVFDGGKPVPEYYTESDQTHPTSYYGFSKLEGEKAIALATDRYTILRTAWLYGAFGHNFLKTMLKLVVGDPQREIKVVHDQFGSPTWSYGLAEQIKRVIDANVSGLFHATSEGYCTWYDLAKTFLHEMEIPCALVPCTTRDYPTPAKRPANSILENRRLKDEGLNIMQDWRVDLTQFVKTFKDHLLREVK